MHSPRLGKEQIQFLKRPTLYSNIDISLTIEAAISAPNRDVEPSPAWRSPQPAAATLSSESLASQRICSHCLMRL
ncbi:hypothetical protein CEXT_338761 [Caerostris extrusa]|uniref:Uncharacterized protein n=1 Tax=Caerostris extrusa TaxID=172846 RepID=A0AAV4THB8_CAEEX|nr:hypothetical protein CEXT_338761 [Caerostris extrusa]